MTRKPIILVVGAVIIFLVGGLAYTYAESPYFKLGRQMKEAREGANSQKVVARVNGKSITAGEYAVHMATQADSHKQLGLPAPSKKDIINLLAKGILVQEEASKRGIKVTDAEVQAYINEQRRSIEEIPAENNQVYIEGLKGQGLTEDEYWSSKETFEGYKSNLIEGELRKQFIGEATTQQDMEKAQGQYDAFMEDLLKKAEVEILDSE
ncbi:MAG: SurA N-terminal domain-containing protein [Actinomycetota bacterium]|nr:SurA N-terminal domain-containing protein [Actinomycetota bacterium]